MIAKKKGLGVLEYGKLPFAATRSLKSWSEAGVMSSYVSDEIQNNVENESDGRAQGSWGKLPALWKELQMLPIHTKS